MRVSGHLPQLAAFDTPDEYSDVAELLRQALNEIAQTGFRDRLAGVERPDALMYSLGAIDRFEQLPSSEVQRIAFEIAVLDRTELDVDDSAQKYRLRALRGYSAGYTSSV